MAATIGRVLYWLGAATAVVLFMFGVLVLFQPNPAVTVLFFGPAIVIYWSGRKLRNFLSEKKLNGYEPTSKVGEVLHWLATVIAGLLFCIAVFVFFQPDFIVAAIFFSLAILIFWSGWALRNFLSKRERPSAPQPRYGPVGYWLVTAANRLCVTLMSAITFAFWAEDVRSFLIPMTVALLIDVVRNFKSPELVLDAKQVESELAFIHKVRAAGETEKYKAPFYRGAIIFAPFVATVIILLVNETESGKVMIAAFADSAFLEHLLPFFKFIERHVSQVRELGFEDRVPLIYAVYVANLMAGGGAFFVILIGYMHRRSIIPPLMCLYRMDKIRNNQNANSKYLLDPVKVLRIALLFYTMIIVIIAIIDVGDKLHVAVSYDIHLDNYVFIYFSLFVMGFSSFGLLALDMFIRMRLDTQGLWLKLIDAEHAEVTDTEK